MALSIDIEIVMANMLRHKDKITLKEIVETSERLGTEIPGIYISTSNRTIFSGIEYNPELFKWDVKEHVVKRVAGSEKCYTSEALEDSFNCEIPPTIKQQFLKAFEPNNWFEGIEGLVLDGNNLMFRGKSVGEFKPIDKLSSEYGLYLGHIRPSVDRSHPAIQKLEEKNYSIVTTRGTCAGGGGG